MKVLIVVALFVAAVHANNVIPAGTPITQCDAQDIECPTINSNEVGNGFELRSYPGTKWVSTLCTGPSLEDFESCSGKSFNKLFEYISGANAQNMVIPMTAPVITMVSPGSGPNCATNFTTSFFLPSALASSAPAPTAGDVFLEDFPEKSKYVIAFDGYADVNDYINFAMELGNNINDASVYYGNYYYFAGYNSPFDIFERRNEVWFIAK